MGPIYPVGAVGGVPRAPAGQVLYAKKSNKFYNAYFVSILLIKLW
jgi:hypothetical protein